MSKTLRELEHDGGEHYSGTFPSRPEIEKETEKKKSINVVKKQTKIDEENKIKRQLDYLMNDDRSWQEI